MEECDLHLTATNSFGSQVEAILTSYCCSVIYAEFEDQVRRIVAERGAGVGTDAHVTSFTKWAALRLVRSIKIGELAGIAAQFDSTCKARFNDAIDAQTQNAWDTILANRRDVAHVNTSTSAISNLTFDELKSLYPTALLVLEHLKDCLEPQT